MQIAVAYPQPGMLAKMVSTLDVLSGGRAWLGIGAAWNEEEATGLGLPFPPTAERFECLEETLQICLQMWSDDAGQRGHPGHRGLVTRLNDGVVPALGAFDSRKVGQSGLPARVAGDP